VTALERHGCTGCHSVDGSPSRAPTLRGLVGKERKVLQDGVETTMPADRAYLARSIVAPDAELVAGFGPGAMPRVKLASAEVDELVAEIESLPAGPPAPGGSMAMLAISASAFVVLHFVLSFMPIRRALIRGLGERGFSGVYSLVVAASFVALIFGYRAAPYVALWEPPAWTRFLPNVVMPFAFVLLVCALTTKSPTLAGKPGAPPVKEAVGIIRITRHPMLWAFALWGLAHIPPNGDLRTLVLFASFAVLALGGMVHIDRRRAALHPETYRPILDTTSLVPFAAIAQKRNRFVLREIGLLRIVGGLALWGASFHFHKLIVGVSPVP
jgi:uncharacterized membrane protein